MIHGKGCVRTPDIIKKTHYRLGAEVPRVIDWNKGYVVEKDFLLEQRDQNGSSSCTAQAASYYCEALDRIELGEDFKSSARYIYSQSNLGYGQGSYIWKAMRIPQIGVALKDSVPDKGSSEAVMIDPSDNSKAILKTRADKYAVIPRGSIDSLAQTIEDYHGFETGFNGNDSMFEPDGTFKIPTSSDWGHAIYICGYKLKDGKKVLITKNSWGSSWGSNGYGFIPEEFVNSGFMFDAYVYAVLTDLDPTSLTNMTAKEVRQLQALEGYKDEAGVTFWTGKPLSDYLKARLPDKIKTLNESL